MRRSLFTVTLLVASTAHAAGRFSAADVPHAHIKQPGRVVIKNTGTAITAYHFFGNVREALLSLRSSRVGLRYSPYGAALFNSQASFVAPADLAPVIADASRAHGVDPRLIAAVARQESALNANAVSPAGACGVMQLMPATARFLGITNIFDPRENVFGGTRYLRTLLDTFHGDLDLTLAAYNAGPGAVQRYGGVPPFPETQNYVRSVRRMYEAAVAR
jgi:soluble lytic murein transglycosylase-like protein